MTLALPVLLAAGQHFGRKVVGQPPFDGAEKYCLIAADPGFFKELPVGGFLGGLAGVHAALWPLPYPGSAFLKTLANPGQAVPVEQDDPHVGPVCREVSDLVRDLSQVLRRSIPQYRREQAPLGVDGDREVLACRVHDRALVDRGIDHGVRLQGLSGCQREEGEERQLVASLLLEVALHRIPERRDLGDVDLDDRGQLSCRLHRRDSALGENLAQTRHRLRGPAQLRNLAFRTLGRLARGCGSCRRLGSCQDVLLADPPSNACSLDVREVDALLLRQLAYERGHIGLAVAVSLRAGLGCSCLGHLGRGRGGLRGLARLCRLLWLSCRLLRLGSRLLGFRGTLLGLRLRLRLFGGRGLRS